MTLAVNVLNGLSFAIKALKPVVDITGNIIEGFLEHLKKALKLCGQLLLQLLQ